MGQQAALLVLICVRPGLTETTVASLSWSADVSRPVQLYFPVNIVFWNIIHSNITVSPLSLIYLGLLALPRQ